VLVSKKVSRSVGSIGALLALAAAGLGCAFGEIRWTDPMGHLMSLEETQKYYSELVRFGDYHTALRFVDPELREKFLERDDLSLKFTDYESGPVDMSEDHRDSEVTVVYLGYEPDVLVERKFKEKQTWFREPPGNDWFVRPYLVDIEEPPPPRVVASASDVEPIDREREQDWNPEE